MSAIKINENDNVAVALKDLSKGTDVLGVTLTEDIESGHKFSLSDILKDNVVTKYGYPIGHATCDIACGSFVHTHNIKTNLKGIVEYSYEPRLVKKDPPKSTKHFLGYKRHDGSVGIRNEIWIINTVGCVNKVAEKIVLLANEKFQGQTDGIFTFVHPFGCSQMGDDHVHTQKILANLVKHPNAAGVLVLGLGCENNNLQEFIPFLAGYDQNRVKFLNAQDSEDEVSDALQIIGNLVKYAKTFKREPVPLSKLTVGLKCGGSDGFSGITANPLVGKFSDMLVQHGGITILSEVPEMFGAETILMNRCQTKELFDKTVDLVNDFKEYFIRHDQEIYENPSPGNKKGGISTLEDKSLGCTQKGGTSNVTDVLDYGDIASVQGLNLLKGPGNDIVAVTGLTAAGAHIVLFTTGRGTPIGGPAPTVKISSNTELATKKSNWIDFNSGVLLEGETMDDTAQRFFEFIIDMASGEVRAKNETNGYREISIFKDGVTL